MNKRQAGVLLHISSLPGKYGIGVMGEDAKRFIDTLHSCEFRNWQLLPLNMIGMGNSPYSSPSAFAGNYIFIDPLFLKRLGLVTDEQVKKCEYSGSVYTADYDFAAKTRLWILKEAFKNITPEIKKGMERFCDGNDWLEPFSLFMAVKECENDRPWWEWSEKHRRYSDFVPTEDILKRADFWKFTQYIFFECWGEIAAYAHKKQVKIIGDMPIYVCMDSADVWSRTDMFQIDPDTLKARQVAGVPPDYFSADGQLWGNPLYDWDKMKADGYKWWITRIENSLKLYDTVRIDHFRAFARYWSVPESAKTAKEGKWVKGPGKGFFDKVYAAIENPSIIAEDLGEYDESVVELLKETALPGMRIVQFGFDPCGDSTHLPHNYSETCVAYIGTHDNNTLLGWLWETDEASRQFALDYCGFSGGDWGKGGYNSPACRKIIEAVWKSHAYLAVISFQDLCGFGCDARMNIPGKPKDNWRYRVSAEQMQNFDKDYFLKINRLFRRTYPHS